MHRIAVVFPGQGSQKVGMLNDFSENAMIRDIFSQAHSVLGYDLWHLIQNDAERLGQTAYTQPALFTVSFALWSLWSDQCREAVICAAGHSLGEYSALAAFGSLSFERGLALVAERGERMQTAVAAGEGGMAAVLGLPLSQIDMVLSDISKANNQVVVANCNTPEQTVIAGHRAAVEEATLALKAGGAKRVIPLEVSVPSHSPLMQTAADSFRAALESSDFTLPSVPVISNTLAKPYDSVSVLKTALIEQLTGRVRWVETMEYCVSQSITHLIECGPGSVLAGLAKKNGFSGTILSLGTVKQFEEAQHAIS